MRFFLILLFTCSFTFAHDIHIAVAANMGHAIQTLKDEFLKTRPKDTISVALASSGKLSAQIQHGAPYALFLSANMNYAQTLFEKGFSKEGPKIYAQGVLMLCSKDARDFSKKLNILTQNNIQKIAIANPKTAPYGKASMETLKNAKLFKSLKAKLIYASNVSEAFTYTLKATDIGFVAKSSLTNSALHVKQCIHVDPTLYSPINQGMILLASHANNPLAKDFFQFLLSPKAQKILKDFGYNTSYE